MRIQLITISALASLAILSARSQTAGASAGSGISSGSPAPVVPALQQRQAVTPPVSPSQLPAGQADQVPSSTVDQTTATSTAANALSSTAANPTAGSVQDQAITAADQEVLAQVRNRVIVPSGNGAWGPLNFSVANGVVTMVGRVQSPAAQQQLEALVRSTPGVVAVVDQLNTSPMAGSVTTTGSPGTSPSGVAPMNSGASALTGGAMSPADQTLLLRVRQSVVPQIQVAAQPIPVNFTVQQGVVTINGAVTSFAQKRQIAALVQQVPGVVQVSDQMLVNSTGTVPNLTPTGRTNGVALPTGPQGTDLPPGRQPQGALPPSVVQGTNNSGAVR